MLKDLQKFAAEIAAAADRVDFAHDDGIDEKFAARAFVFCGGDFSSEEAAQKYLYSQIEYGRQKLNKWRMPVMKRKARLIIEAGSDGIALLMRK